MVWGTPEGLLHDGRGDAAQDHRGCVLIVGRDAKMPWERCSMWECGIKRQGMGLKFLNLRDYLCRVHQEVA